MKKAGLLIYRPMNFFSILRRKILHDFHPTGRWQPLRTLHQSPKMSVDFWELCTTRIQRCRLSSSYHLLPRQDLSSRHEAARLVGSGCTRFFFTVPPHFQHRNKRRVAANLFQEISNVKELPVIWASFSPSLYWIWGGIVKENPCIMYSHLNQFQFLNHYSWLFAEVNLKYSRCPCGQALLLPQRGPWDRLTRRTPGLPCIKCLQGEFLEDEGILISSCST